MHLVLCHTFNPPLSVFPSLLTLLPVPSLLHPLIPYFSFSSPSSLSCTHLFLSYYLHHLLIIHSIIVRLNLTTSFYFPPVLYLSWRISWSQKAEKRIMKRSKEIVWRYICNEWLLLESCGVIMNYYLCYSTLFMMIVIFIIPVPFFEFIQFHTAFLWYSFISISFIFFLFFFSRYRCWTLSTI